MSDVHVTMELNGELYELEGYVDTVDINHEYGGYDGMHDMTVKLEVKHAKMGKMEVEEE